MNVAAQHLTQCLQAWALLRAFNKADAKGNAAAYTADATAKSQLRAVLQHAREHSNPGIGWDSDSPALMLGILASDVRLGMRALRDWTQAFGLPMLTPEIRVRGVLLCAASLVQVALLASRAIDTTSEILVRNTCNWEACYAHIALLRRTQFGCWLVAAYHAFRVGKTTTDVGA